MIVLVGSNGSMGKRYQAILRHLEKRFLPLDVETSLLGVCEAVKQKDCKGVIIATPTNTHFEYCMALVPFGKPVLCEKPITKNLDELEQILLLAKTYKTPFDMTLQYKKLLSYYGADDMCGFEGSHYNFYNHGKDGLVWDCLQTIALAKGFIKLDEKSPIWSCSINGVSLDINKMDRAYVDFVWDWIRNPGQQDFSFLKIAHLKAKKIEDEEKANGRGEKRFDCCAGAQHEHKVSGQG